MNALGLDERDTDDAKDIESQQEDEQRKKRENEQAILEPR